MVLAVASYSILIAVMLLTGRLVARETGRTGDRAGGDGPGGDDVGHAGACDLVLGRPAALGRLRDPGDTLVRAVVSAVGRMRSRWCWPESPR